MIIYCYVESSRTIFFYKEIEDTLEYPMNSYDNFFPLKPGQATSSTAAELRHLPLEEIKARCPEEVEESRMYVPWHRWQLVVAVAV